MALLPPCRRRSWLVFHASAAVAGASLAMPARAQPGGAARPLGIVQIADTSPAQQDVSRDFLIGSRAAWQDLNARGGLRGRPVLHRVVETDGSAAATRDALAAAAADPACIALSGCVGDPVAAALPPLLLRGPAAGLANVAPWLQRSGVDIGTNTFLIFAGHEAQIAHAVRNLAVMGVAELGVIYADAAARRQAQAAVARSATALGLRVRDWQPDAAGLLPLGQRLGPQTPAILLFVGGAPELQQFVQGLGRQKRQRYVVALADVSLQVLAPLGLAARSSASVIAAQAVPLVTAGVPVVRAYRDVLARLFDEAPSPLGLAGFVAARYTAEVIAAIDGTPTRAAVLAAFQKRTPVDLGGFRIDYDAGGRSAGPVTQSMLAPDGRIVG
ncbi:ABC transporter substrate-binding protein [Xylophilus sp.]|uniref:ABC transporter substrate-binding protein n=1 Tax=Xylophilus sp. TaxID=2653893 RepID=UPI0013BC5103|nr:ABC transporter substrate-binding protein [Xylophilus sp.]KAF1047150.1 MAG: hypothetical protein GAK38_02031 [Xylophilus sp.]